MWEEGARIYGTPGVPNNFPVITSKRDKADDVAAKVIANLLPNIDFQARMAKYHNFWKFLAKKHCFGNK